MDFGEFLKIQSKKIDLRLEEILGEHLELFEKTSIPIAKIFDQFIKSNQGGKRVRGALVLAGYRIAGGEDFSKVLDAAAAFEIFQTAILAQDDVIDKSLVRRSKDTLYQALGGDHKAVSETICLSDIGIFLSFRLLSSLRIEDSSKIKGINLFSQTLMQTVLGEMLDIEASFTESEFLEEDAIKIGLLKTARYSITGPLTLGATLGGGDLELLKRLQKFGDQAGIAFQIQDDILGIFGDEKVTGKSAVSDIKECKATVLIAYAQKRASSKQKGILKEYYGYEEIKDDEVEKVRQVFIETGALAYAKGKAAEYFRKAKESFNGENQALLYSLVDYLKGRDR